MDEFELIRAIREHLDGSTGDVPLVDNGDDAAVLAASEDASAFSVDAQIEGTHFDRAWLDASDLGYRSLVSALSDLAAMGAAPRAALLSWTLPATLDAGYPVGIARGVGEAARAYQVRVIGGNLSRGEDIALHTTVIGQLHGTPWTRGGARPGDALYLSGSVGAAGLGWRALRAGIDAPAFTTRWRRPRARFDVVERARRDGTPSPSACIDVSDGLVADARHLAHAGSVQLVIEQARVPTLDGHRELAERLGEDPDAIALGGGEDYELLYTAPPDAGGDGVEIGRVLEGAASVVIVDADGAPMTLALPGHRHF